MKGNGVNSDQRMMPVLLNYGGAKKFIADMNEAELSAARQSILQRAKEKAFLRFSLSTTSVMVS
jgi:hypothetical protein